MGKSAGKMMNNPIAPDGIVIREFKCGVTGGSNYLDKFAYTPYRKQSFAFRASPVAALDAAGAPIAIVTGANMRTQKATLQLFVGNAASADRTVVNSFVSANDSNDIQFGATGLTTLNRCVLVFGVFIHARRAYVRLQEGTGQSREYVDGFLTSGQDGFRFVEQAFNDQLETMSIKVAEPNSGRVFPLGSGKDNRDMIAGFDVYKGREKYGMYIPLTCPFISGPTQTVDAITILVEQHSETEYKTDGTNIAAAGDLTYNPQADGTVFFEYAAYVVVATICCPPDKLCDYDDDSIGLNITRDVTGE